MDYKILTQYYTQYLDKKIKRKLLEDAVHQYVYLYPKTHYTYSFNQDLCGEFWSTLEKKIPKLIESFTDIGVPFGGYINFILKFQFITFVNQYFNKNRAQKLYENKDVAITLNQPLEQHAENTCDEDIPNTKNFITMIEFLENTYKRDKDKQRLWWFVLYHSPLIVPKRIFEISSHLNIKKSECTRVLKELKSDILFQRNKKKLLEEKCNAYFFQRNIYEQKMDQTILLTHEKDWSIKMRGVYKTRFQQTFEKLQKLTFTISHSKIATVLHVPKGTVDSGIALLRKRCQHLLPEGRQAGLV